MTLTSMTAKNLYGNGTAGLEPEPIPSEITEESAKSLVGRKVIFNYGAMHGESEPYTITGYRWNQWGVQLTALNAAGGERTISGFTTVGIGCYLQPETEA